MATIPGHCRSANLPIARDRRRSFVRIPVTHRTCIFATLKVGATWFVAVRHAVRAASTEDFVGPPRRGPSREARRPAMGNHPSGRQVLPQLRTHVADVATCK